MAGARQAVLDRLYRALPVLASDRRWPRVVACVGLSAASFTILYILGVAALMLGLSFIATHPGWLNFLALIPGFLVLIDKKARLTDQAAYLILSWLAMMALGSILVVLIWAAGA